MVRLELALQTDHGIDLYTHNRENTHSVRLFPTESTTVVNELLSIDAFT